MENKIWTVEEITNLLRNSDNAVIKATLAIRNRQTPDEQASEATKHHNNMGYNGIDAKIMTSFGNQIAKQQAAGRPLWLSEKQLAIARKKIFKYAGQLTKIANKEV
jgi:2-succinyl-5-enolpyruvyl-6-hydroxy-3-cyclohexene-1-carboxylate synthase